MTFASEIARRRVEGATVAYNSYVIPGYANVDSVPLLMAAAVLSSVPEAFDRVETCLMDTLSYMDADTVMHLAREAVGKTNLEELGVYRGALETLRVAVAIDQLRCLVVAKDTDAIAKWISETELSVDSYLFASAYLGEDIVQLAEGHPKELLLRAWTGSAEEEPK